MNSGPGFWNDARYRADAYETISRADDNAQTSAIAYVDAEITTMLKLCGCPRGRIEGITIVEGFTSWLARKSPECTLSLARYWMNHWNEQLHQPDGITGAWIHESIHALAPYADLQEYPRWMGYEEGLAEGLTEIIMASTETAHVNRTFGYYVLVYRELARMIDVDVEARLRSLWRYPVDSVRSGFVDVFDEHLVKSGRDRLPTQVRQRWQLVADMLFSSSRHNSQPDGQAIRELLERIVR